MMPFLQDLDIVATAVRDVVQEEVKGLAFRADDTFDPGAITEQIKEAIQKADFCVADVTGANPNVLWEAGYAHALGKPIIQISQDTGALPFDIRALRTLRYSLDELQRSPELQTSFHRALKSAVEAVINTLRGRPRVLGPPHDELRNLAKELGRQTIYKGRHEPLLPILLEALEWDRVNGPKDEWRSNDAPRLATALLRSAGGAAQDAFWWLIAHGVFAYNQIDEFQSNGSNGVRDNVPLVEISERGVHLLNQLREPIP
jgi:hypothetical protein